MSVMQINAASLSRELGTQVPEIYVVIAKHEVLGLDTQTIMESVGATQEELDEVKQDKIYQDILLLLRAEHAKGRVDTDLTYDALEQVAVERLFKRVQHESDGEFLLKVAMMANRATRRSNPNNVLDTTAQGVRIPLTLTKRITERFLNDGTREISREAQLSIADGSMQNPSFEDVDGLLSVSTKPWQPKPMAIKTRDAADPSLDELDDLMQRKGN